MSFCAIPQGCHRLLLQSEQMKQENFNFRFSGNDLKKKKKSNLSLFFRAGIRILAILIQSHPIGFKKQAYSA